MKNYNKNLAYAFTIAMASCFSTPSFAQVNDGGWILVKESNNVQFYYKTVICNNNSETILYKIINNSNEAASINWTTFGIGNDEATSIPAMNEIAGDCRIQNNLSFPVPAGAAVMENNLPIEITQFN